MLRYIIACLLFVGFYSAFSQETPIEKILSEGSREFQDVLLHADSLEVQIIYSQIHRNAEGNVYLETYTFGIDEKRYFYPASTVKMPVACFALEKLNEMNDPRLTMDTPMAFGAVRKPQYALLKDSTEKDGKLTIRHLIKKIFLTSDNEAYNMLYAFCGQKDINDRLNSKGLSRSKITHRVGAGQFTHDDNKLSNPYFFYDSKGLLHVESARYNSVEYDHIELDGCRKGDGYYSKGNFIEEPFDFCKKNFLSLQNLHDILIAIVIPDAQNAKAQFNLTSEQRKALWTFMSQRPNESIYPAYPGIDDNYVKFLQVGDLEEGMPESLRIFNKVGYAYGYLTDVAYIVDLDRRIEFVLSATIHVNANRIYNDDTYEYDSVGIPFLAELGRLVYKHESRRNHNFDTEVLKRLHYD